MSGPLPLGSMASPNRLSRAVAETLLLLTSVNVVVQFSSAARCAIEPMKLRPEIEVACCSMVNVCPAIEKVLERSPPPLASTWNVTVLVPVPDAGLVRITDEGTLPTVHGQPN